MRAARTATSEPHRGRCPRQRSFGVARQRRTARAPEGSSRGVRLSRSDPVGRSRFHERYPPECLDVPPTDPGRGGPCSSARRREKWSPSAPAHSTETYLRQTEKHGGRSTSNELHRARGRHRALPLGPNSCTSKRLSRHLDGLFETRVRRNRRRHLSADATVSASLQAPTQDRTSTLTGPPTRHRPSRRLHRPSFCSHLRSAHWPSWGPSPASAGGTAPSWTTSRRRTAPWKRSSRPSASSRASTP